LREVLIISNACSSVGSIIPSLRLYSPQACRRVARPDEREALIDISPLQDVAFFEGSSLLLFVTGRHGVPFGYRDTRRGIGIEK
jgi:hypothetical protein